MTSDPILPGATIGILGGGQLGRMFAIAARRMGYRVHVLSPEFDTPAGQVADVEIVAPYEDLEAVAGFARDVDVVTFEFENVPLATTIAADGIRPVRPAGRVLHTTQNRLREKTFLAENGFPVAPFRVVRSVKELESAVRELGLPSILKTAEWGYDGKGQVQLTLPDDVATAWSRMSTREAVLEQFVDFATELSVVAARGLDGEVRLYDPVDNRHERHILDVSVSPARIPPNVARDAAAITNSVVEALDVVGVMCVEFFLSRDGRLLINELAPRPHNSGHLTIDSHVTCQFEQQVRAVCGLPLGPTRQITSSAMANLLGEIWTGAGPNWVSTCLDPDVKLHLYGKLAARPGRKMGHLTAIADTPDEAVAKVLAARNSLQSESGARSSQAILSSRA